MEGEFCFSEVFGSCELVVLRLVGAAAATMWLCEYFLPLPFCRCAAEAPSAVRGVGLWCAVLGVLSGASVGVGAQDFGGSGWGVLQILGGRRVEDPARPGLEEGVTWPCPFSVHDPTACGGWILRSSTMLEVLPCPGFAVVWRRGGLEFLQRSAAALGVLSSVCSVRAFVLVL